MGTVDDQIYEELYLPYTVGDQPPATPPPPASVSDEDLEHRPPPANANRRDRKAHLQAEAARIATLQAQVPSLRAAELRHGPPKRIGRAGRRAWRRTYLPLMADRRRAAALQALPDRVIGVGLLMAAFAVALALRVFVFTGDQESSDGAATAPATSPPTVAAATAPIDGAVEALTQWAAATCPLPDAQWGPGVQALMTPDGWAQRDTRPVVVTAGWRCSNIIASRGTVTPDGPLVTYTATRTITTTNTRPVDEHVTVTRLVVAVDGRWLVDGNAAG